MMEGEKVEKTEAEEHPCEYVLRRLISELNTMDAPTFDKIIPLVGSFQAYLGNESVRLHDPEDIGAGISLVYLSHNIGSAFVYAMSFPESRESPEKLVTTLTGKMNTMLKVYQGAASKGRNMAGSFML